MMPSILCYVTASVDLLGATTPQFSTSDPWPTPVFKPDCRLWS